MRKFANISNFEHLSNNVKYNTTFNGGCTGRGCGNDGKKGNGQNKRQEVRRPAIVRDDSEDADTWAGALKRMQKGKPTLKDIHKWWI